ncbi:MAG: class I SAM-dependent methyltransferase [Candidatus Lernaella stagnicola]|nr:class I SAM-dependent methyltransferase [Candidatus Lernaella stagnicola]
MKERCPLCRAVHRVRLYRRTRSGDVHRCTACGFVYSAPRGTPDAEAPSAFTDNPEAYFENARHRMEVLARHTGVTSGRLLDVGCYDGPFMLAAQRLGFAVEGVEIDERGAAAARERGLEVVVGPFEEVDLHPPYDVVTFVHSLEHFEDPLAALTRAGDLLRPGGALLVEVPDFDAWSRRLLGRRWRQFIADHFHFFEPRTLRRCLEETGFADAHLQNVGKVATIGLLADRLGRYYQRGLGRVMTAAAGRWGLQNRRVSLDLGDILLAVATRRDRGYTTAAPVRVNK